MVDQPFEKVIFWFPADTDTTRATKTVTITNTVENQLLTQKIGHWGF